MDLEFKIEDHPELVGTGVEARCGATVYGTATHFVGYNGLARCGAPLARDIDSADWVSCRRCMTIARKAAAE